MSVTSALLGVALVLVSGVVAVHAVMLGRRGRPVVFTVTAPPGASGEEIATAITQRMSWEPRSV